MACNATAISASHLQVHWHIILHYALSQALRNGCLAHTGLANKDRIVLCTPAPSSSAAADGEQHPGQLANTKQQVMRGESKLPHMFRKKQLINMPLNVQRFMLSFADTKGAIITADGCSGCNTSSGILFWHKLSPSLVTRCHCLCCQTWHHFCFQHADEQQTASQTAEAPQIAPAMPIKKTADCNRRKTASIYPWQPYQLDLHNTASHSGNIS
jgi:hypothetical protein